MTVIQRALLADLKKWVDRKEILAIKGPRQAGKTTLLRLLSEWLVREKGVDERNVVNVTFEDRGELDAFAQNPKDFVRSRLAPRGKTYLLLDEAQYAPDAGQRLKLVYDLFGDGLKLVITGSSSLELKSQTGRFLVGRLLEFELLPLSFSEFLGYREPGLADMFAEWNGRLTAVVRGEGGFPAKKDPDVIADRLLPYLGEYAKFGGYPAVATSSTDEEKQLVLRNLINTYIDRDIVSFLQITDTVKFRRLMVALAASNGGILRMDPLANEIGSHFRELTRLIDVLEQTYVVRRVLPYHGNRVTELRKAPKLYFFDAGLRNALLGAFGDLDRRTDSGPLIEAVVLGELSRHAPTRYWRTTSGAEVDFVSQPRPGLLVPVEVKFHRFSQPKVGKSLRAFIGRYSPADAVVLTRDFWGETPVGGTRVSFLPVCYA